MTMGGLGCVCVGGGGGLRLHRGAVVTLRCRRRRRHSRCCSNPSTQTALCSRQHGSPCDLHLWKTYGRSALPTEPGGQSCGVAYVTQTSQTPGGDERHSSSFARSTLSAQLRLFSASRCGPGGRERQLRRVKQWLRGL